MNNYESFKPIDRKVAKTNGTILERIFSKIGKRESSDNASFDRESVKNASKDLATKEHKKTVIPGALTTDNYRRPSLQDIRTSEEDVPYVTPKSAAKLTLNMRPDFPVANPMLDNLNRKHKLNQVFWMPDSICHKCYSCEDEFTAIRRRHHCRMCGQIFCYRCCAFELPGSLWNQAKPQRSCNMCFQTFYANSCKRKPSNLSCQSLNNQETSSSNSNRRSNSPSFSLRSDNLLPCNNNIESSNRNLSFSSNDVSTDQIFCFSDTKSNKLEDLDDFETLKRNNSVPDLVDINDDVALLRVERKLSSVKLNPKTFIQNHFRTITSSKPAIPTSSAEPPCSQRVQKEILLLVWKEIIEETQRLRTNYFDKVKLQTQTRSIECQFSFPNEDQCTENDRLNVIFTNATSSKPCIHGCSLVNWMFQEIAEVKDRSHAAAICQLYLEMQLISPYHHKENSKSFKDDSTMYVIREVSSDYSPRLGNKDYDSSHFTDFELKGYLSSNSLQKSCGNSTFYADDDSRNSDTKMQDVDKTSLQYPSSCIHVNTEPKLDTTNQISNPKFNTNLWNKSCEYLERLLKQELRDYNLDISWCNIILPICKMICDTVSPNISHVKSTNDIRDYIHIKKIPDSLVPDCQVVYSISMSKNVDYPVMKDLKNPSVILIRSSIDYWRHKKLVSLDPLLLQEEEYLKNCVKKIMNLKPDIVVVEGNVSLIAKELMEICGLVLISNVRKVQMDRLARMLGSTIFDSVDSLGVNVDAQLARCNQFSVQQFRLSNGRHKYLIFFKLFNNKDGCTLLLRCRSLSELVRLKYITRFMIMTFRNTYLELACLNNFQMRGLGLKSATLPTAMPELNEDICKETSIEFLNIIDTRIIALSPHVHYLPPTGLVRKLFNPELQGRLLSLDILNISWREKLNDVLKRKQRHICAEFYDELRMKVQKHPRLHEPAVHSFLNCIHGNKLDTKEKCVLYSDFRNNGGRYQKVNENIETSLVSSVCFDSSDQVISGGFLTREQETRWREMEKKRFESIRESFNPRNYQRIILLYSIQTNKGICEKPRKISLAYYESSDKILGSFIKSMLSDTSICPLKCEASFFEHVHKFVHNGGCIEVSVHQMESDSHRKLLNSISAHDRTGYSTIKLWNWCSRCDKILDLQDMTEETFNLSLGRFFDMLFNLNMTDINLVPGQCMHSLQTAIHYYFTESSMSRALEIKYKPIVVYEFQSPELLVSIRNNKSMEDMFKMFKCLQKDIEHVTEIKTKYNIDIKDKIMKLKGDSKVEHPELWDFLQQDSNTVQYSQTMEDIHNLMEKIYNFNHEFDVDLFKKNQHVFNAEIVHMWIDVVNFVTKWDQRLSDSYEREEKEKKQLKLDTKNIKNSNEDLLMDQDISLSKSYNNSKVLLEPGLQEIKDSAFKKTLSHIPDVYVESEDSKKKFFWNSYEDQNGPLVSSQKPESRNDSQVDYKPTPHVERSSGNTAAAFTRKLFPSFFNTNNLKNFEEPTLADCSYVFPDIYSLSEPVVVKDDAITSVISFALSSNVYLDKVSEMAQLTNCRPSAKSELSATTTYTQHDSKLTADIGQIDGLNYVNAFNNERLDKDKYVPSVVETMTKDRDICVRYLNRPEIEEQSEVDNVEMNSNIFRMDNDEIKIDVLTEDGVLDDASQRPSVNNKATITGLKKGPKNDLELTFNNHKAKCFCRIYNALQFEKLREEILGPDKQSYIRSLMDCKNWTTTGGKSGLKFRKTMDDRYIIKQLHTTELNGFRKFHEKYFEYIMDRIAKKQKCVLAKIMGIYHVDYSNSLTKVTEKLDFLVMENLFFNQKPSKIFDLKGNRQIAINVTADKVGTSDASVMQDKEFISYTRSKPLYVSWQTQIALKETLTRDTDFLRDLPVMDYSLLVGLDDGNDLLVIGIIDYLRMFTIDKLIEMHVKQRLRTPHGELPTVIQPQRYQKRFLDAIDEYFLICPIPWDCLLLQPASPAAVVRNFRHKSALDTLRGHRSHKSRTLKRSFEKNVDENKLRWGLLQST